MAHSGKLWTYDFNQGYTSGDVGSLAVRTSTPVSVTCILLKLLLHSIKKTLTILRKIQQCQSIWLGFSDTNLASLFKTQIPNVHYLPFWDAICEGRNVYGFYNIKFKKTNWIYQ